MESTFNGYESTFAKRLRELMTDHKTTQKELADIVGTTRQAISQYADGSVQPTIEKLYKISSYFNVSSDWLIGKNDIKSSNTDDIAINKRLGLTQEAIESLSFYVEYANMTPPIENALKTINFLLADKEEPSGYLLDNIAEYFYGSEILDIFKNAHYHIDNVVEVGSGDKETNLGAHIIKNFLREDNVLNMLLLEIQKSLVKSMEYIRKAEPNHTSDKIKTFGSYDLVKNEE